MFEKPRFRPFGDRYHLDIDKIHADRLLDGLREAGFEAALLEETVGDGDYYSETEHVELATIDLPPTTDQVALHWFIREWSA